MTDVDAAVEVLRALAEIRRTLVSAEVDREREGDGARASSSLAVWETRPEDVSELPDEVRRGAYVGVRIETFLAVDVEGGEAEWTSIANNRLDGSGWKIERVVMLQTHYGGEVHVLASRELPEVTCPDSLSLARRLPRLVDELLALPIPDAPDAPDPESHEIG